MSNTAQRYWNHSSCKTDTIFRASSVEAVRSTVTSGIGISIPSDMVRPRSLEGRRVETIEVADKVPTTYVDLAWLNSKKHSAAAKTFVEFMHLGMSAGQPRHMSATEGHVRN